MKVFVTGVGGQIGHYAMNELAGRGYEGMGTDIASEYNGALVITAPYVQMNITDKEAVYKAAKPINSRLDKCKLVEAGSTPLPT